MKIASTVLLLVLAAPAMGASTPKKEPAPKIVFKEPDGFAGLKWGARQEGAERLKNFQFRADTKDTGRIVERRAWVTVGDSLLDATLKFFDGGFAQVIFRADENYAKGVTEAFKLRYGQPTVSAVGVDFWMGSTVMISLEKTPTRVGNERIIIGIVGHKRLLDHESEEKKQREKKSAESTAKGL